LANLRAFQLGSGLISGTAITSIYTVPSGHRVILKDLTLQEVSGVACTINVRLNSFGTWFAAPLSAYPAGGSYHDQKLWVVLSAGDVLKLQRSNSGDYTYVASGSLMTI
jgi:hypothetical protein